MAPLRVLLVGQAPQAPGGISIVQRLHTAALERRDDVEVRTVVTFDEASVARRVRLMTTGIATAVALLLAGRADVLDVHMGKGGSVLRKGVVLTVARLRGVPAVAHVHAGAFVDWFDAMPAAGRALVRWLLRPDRLVVLSSAAREAYLARLDLAPERVLVVPNPVEWPESLPERSGEGPLGVVFLGRLIDRKGVFDLVDAVAALPAEQQARLRVTLAGHGDADAVRAAVTTAGLDGVVDVRSYVGPEERDALLGGAQILVLPSYWEGLPMSVLEGMAWGLAPVVTPVGGVVDILDDGVNGVLVPVADPPALSTALEKLIADDDLRARIGARARADVRPMGTDRWADDLVTLYRSLGN